MSSEVGLRSRVLLVSDNGHGLGHVTRLLAIARRLPSEVEPFFLTLSESHRTIAELGFCVEYFPSKTRLGSSMNKKKWNGLFAIRLLSLVDRVRPAAIVVDHVGPPEALRSVRQRYPDVKIIWIRRPLWRRGRQNYALAMRDVFHDVIEPLDLATPIDAGLTVRDQQGVSHVWPITLLSQSEAVARVEAKEFLGLDPDLPAVLVHLSADSDEKLQAMVAKVARDIRRLSNAQVFAPLHVLKGGGLTSVEGVVVRSVYPLARYMRAFEAAVATAGYNSFHELVASEMPTVFIPRQTDSLDDQKRRARFAAMAGAGWYAKSVDAEDFVGSLSEALDPARRRRVVRAMSNLHPGNGAADAAAIVAQAAVSSVHHETPEVAPPSTRVEVSE